MHRDAGDDARLLQIVHAVGEHARRDDDQEDAGPEEEPREVDADEPAVDQVRDDDGGQDAEDGPDRAEHGVRAAH